MKVSVIIPVYNSEKYLKNCILSVINQTLKEIEIIIINDCSKDNSYEIIKNFAEKDKRIKIINKVKNLGYGINLNKAIKLAQAEYISIVESDDTIEKNMLEILVKYAQEGNYDFIKSDFYKVKNNKKFKKNLFKKQNTHHINNILKCPQLLTIQPSIWSAIYKKDFLYKNNISFNETQGASYQDTTFQFKCFYCANNFKLINIPLYNYKTDNPNSSTNTSDKVFEIINEFYTINSFFKPQNSDIAAFKLLFELRAYLWNYKRIKNKYNNIFLNEISDIFKNYDFNPFFNNDKIPLKEKIKAKMIINNSIIVKIIFKAYKTLVRTNGK